MVIYLVVGIVVVLLSSIIDKRLEKKNKKINYIISAIIILILSILGGLRGSDIGTDIHVYGKRWFEVACRCNSFASYRGLISSSDVGYLLLNYVVSIFTNNFNVFLFIHQLICNVLIFSTLYKYRDKAPLWLSMLTFLCLYYLRSYNYLRQSLALSFLFFGFRYIDEKKLIKYLIVIFIATQFHFTAIIGIFIYFIYYVFTSNFKYKNLLTIAVILATIFVSCNITSIIRILYSLNLVNYRIYNYTLQYMIESFDFSLIETCFKLLFILFYIVNLKKINKNEKMNYTLGIFLIMDIIFFQIRGIILYADRFAFYFGYLTTLLLPQIPGTFKNENTKKFMYLVLSMCLVAFWFFKFVMENSGEVYPYNSIL